MKQVFAVSLVVEFPDDALQPDVEEAFNDAVDRISKMLIVMPKVKGKSKRGVEVAFAVKGVARQVEKPTE